MHLGRLSRLPSAGEVARAKRWALPAAGGAVALLAVAVGTTQGWDLLGSQQQDDAPPPGPGWQEVFVDDFTGAAGDMPSDGNWVVARGSNVDNPPGGTSGEVQSSSNAPANLGTDGNGNLRIVPVRDEGGQWTSARIETARTNFTAAERLVLRIESRIQLPDVADDQALGYWPAFRAIGAPARDNPALWPSVGQVDVVESVNGEDRVRGSLHCGATEGGPCHEPTGMTANRSCPDQPCAGRFHTYSFEWDRTVSPNQLRWLVDDEEFFRIDQDAVDTPTWERLTGHSGWFLALSVGMGGRLPDDVADAATPTDGTVPGMAMLVDYVAVWTRQAAGAGRESAAPSPPDEDERQASSSRRPSSTTTTTAPSTTTTAAPTTTTTEPTTTTTAAPTTPAAPPAPPPGRDAYATTMAVNFDGQSGVQLEATNPEEGGGNHVGFVANGDWVRYDGVDFGATSPSGFAARVASGVHEGAYGTVTVHLDSPDGWPVARFDIANTGGWFNWTTASTGVLTVTGHHTVYLVFTSPQPEEFLNLRWFQFVR